MGPKHSRSLAHRALLVGLSAGACLLGSVDARAADYFVAPTGDDANAGSMDKPFASLQKGADVAEAGDTVFIRGGTYSIKTPKTSGAGVSFTKSGTEQKLIKYWAYQAEKPIFDFADMTLSTSGYTHGFVVKGSWLHFKGLELTNVKMNTFSNNAIATDTGGHNIFELLDLHHISGNGIFIGKSTGGNLILNTDAHDNYDATSNQGDGQNADGFGVHYQTSGDVTTVRGCRAWWNSDDGYDLINQEVPVIIENSWSTANGYINSGKDRPGAGNGAGFKMGSSKTGVRHIVRGNLAWKNANQGFYANHSSGGNDWFNNTSYNNNGVQFNMLASDASDSSVTIILSGDLVHKMRNNIAFPNKTANMMGVDSTFNTWDLMITPAATQFVSVDDAGALGPREADGSLPNIDFMKLKAESPLIDSGTDVGLPMVGAAPDLGAFEYGAVAATTGGVATAGGATNGGVATSGGSVDVPAGGATPFGGSSSAGTSNATAGQSATGGNGANSAGATGSSSAGVATAADEGSGCGCKLASSGSNGPSFGAILPLAALALLRRSRVRDRSQAHDTRR
jgi:pectate lyase-like protein